jgi:iron complex outermembrane receptor protein
MPVNSYTVADAIIRYDFGYLQPRLKGLQFSINALNLFDHEYVSNCSTDNCVYGLRRQVMGTLKYRY